MAAGLYETLQAQIARGFTETAASKLEEYEIGVRKGLEASFAAILGGLQRNAADSVIMTDVAKQIGDPSNGPGVLTNLSNLMTAGAASTSASLSSRMLASLFGERQSRIVAGIARASGIGTASAASLFGVAGSMVLALLAKRLGVGVPGTTALTGLLAGERVATAAAVPPYLTPLIGIGGQEAANPMAHLMAGGLRSLLLLAATLAFVFWLFSYVLPPLQGTVAVKVPELPEMPKVSGRITTDWGKDKSAADYEADLKWGDSRETKSDRPSSTAELQPLPKTWTTTPAPSADTSPSSKWWNDEASPSTAAPPSKTVEVTPDAATTPARRPPISGLVRIGLQDGKEIDVVPYGIESNVKNFVEDRYTYVDKTKWFDFDRVRFLSGSTELTPGSRAQLRNVAALMSAYPNVHLKIGGYTDNVGDPASNMRLSDNRARSVVNALIKLGVAPDRLESEGYGEQHPIAENATPEGRAKNRRTAVSVRQK